MELYLLWEEDLLYPGWKTTDYVEKRKKELELKLVTNGRRYGPLFKKTFPSKVWIRTLRRIKTLFTALKARNTENYLSKYAKVRKFSLTALKARKKVRNLA